MSDPSALPTTNRARAGALDRRVAVRYPAHPDASCQAAGPAGGVCPAWVRDISATGVALVTEQAFEPGTWLTVELENAESGVACTLRARVVHHMELPPSERWLHGCAFERGLTREELRAFAE
jgi:hypothetical protein